MPRQRMIKVEFFDSETLAGCSHTARLLFIGLWVMGDDYGNLKLNPHKLRLQVFPYDQMTDEHICAALCELEAAGCIKGYEVGGERYITTPNFAVYQTVKKPSNTNIPEPPKSTQEAQSTELVRNWYSTSGELVPHQYPTSTPLVTHQNALTCGYSTSTPLVPHQYPTSGAQKKEGRKEEVTLPNLRVTSSPQVDESGDGGAGAEKAAPPTAATNEEIFAWVDENYPDHIAEQLQHRANEERMEAEATPCPPEILAKMKGGAA